MRRVVSSLSMRRHWRAERLVHGCTAGVVAEIDDAMEHVISVYYPMGSRA